MAFALDLRHGALILDGGNGTELTRRGVPTRLPLWSAAALLSHPHVVEVIHREFVEAGAQIIVANTFRTNPRTLARAGLVPRGAELAATAVALARRAIESAAPLATRAPAWVAASVAPVEDCYRPALVPDEATLQAEHEQLAAWLAAARPDLVWIETMNAVREARAAAAAARTAGLPCVVSFVLNQDGALLGGEPLAAALDAVEPFEPLALGLNCMPPDGVTAHLPALRRLTSRPIAAYAHIGNPEPTLGWRFSQACPPQQYAEYARRWVELGASIVGGCCGTAPAHIAAITTHLGPPVSPGARPRAAAPHPGPGEPQFSD